MTTIDLPEYETYLQVIYPNPTTAGMYLDIALRYVKHFGTELTEQNIFKYLVKYKNSIPNRAGLKALCKFLKNKEIEIPIPKSRKRGKEKIKFLTDDQVQLIISTLPPFEKLISQIYYETGLRLRELINLEIKGIDCPQRRLKGIGKGLMPFDVRISQDCANKLMRHLAIYDYDTYPFHYPKVKYSARKFYYKLKKHCRVNLGIENVHPHRFRHALGHKLRTELRFDVEEIRSVLRHKDVSTTQIYVTATREEIESKIENELFSQVKSDTDQDS